MVMEEKTPISFSLPSDQDEGICALMVARFLGEKHNRFVERVDELLLLRGRELQRSNTKQSVVSSRFFTPGTNRLQFASPRAVCPLLRLHRVLRALNSFPHALLTDHVLTCTLAAHAITYDLKSGFLPFVEKQCVQYSGSGQVRYCLAVQCWVSRSTQSVLDRVRFVLRAPVPPFHACACV